jgi:hypothetical protein
MTMRQAGLECDFFGAVITNSRDNGVALMAGGNLASYPSSG